MISKDTINEVLAKADIVQEIGQRIQLRKTGTNLVGLCPFHGEKSPSFSVSPTKQFFHCFGCGAHGDVIEFLIKHDGMDFHEAIEDLGSKLGVLIKHENTHESAEKKQVNHRREDDLVGTLSIANDYFRHSYYQNPAVQLYAQGVRKLSAEVMDVYGIGYAPAFTDGLRDAFKNYDSNQLLIDAGLCINAESGDRKGERYDRFRDRLMFPIRDTKGRIIGFGGRVINNEKTPKYLNSPETEVFLKHRVLYGLHEGRASIMKNKRAFVVEGYIDVVTMAMYGIGNAVAAMGTALTQDHARLLMRFTRDICFLFDGDKAGQSAAWKSAQTVLPLLQPGCSFNFLTLPNNQDPDEFLSQYGAQAFNEFVDKNASSLSEFIFKRLAYMHGKDGELVTLESKANFAKDAQALCELIPCDNPLKGLMLNETHRLTGVGSPTASNVPQAPSPSSAIVRLRQQIQPKKQWLPPDEFKAQMQAQRNMSSSTGSVQPGRSGVTQQKWKPWEQTPVAPTLPDNTLWNHLKRAITLAPQAAYEQSPHITCILDNSNPAEMDLIMAFDKLETMDSLDSPPGIAPDEQQAAVDLLANATLLIAKYRKKQHHQHLQSLRDAGQLSESDYLAEAMRTA